MPSSPSPPETRSSDVSVGSSHKSNGEEMLETFSLASALREHKKQRGDDGGEGRTPADPPSRGGSADTAAGADPAMATAAIPPPSSSMEPASSSTSTTEEGGADPRGKIDTNGNGSTQNYVDIEARLDTNSHVESYDSLAPVGNDTTPHTATANRLPPRPQQSEQRTHGGHQRPHNPATAAEDGHRPAPLIAVHEHSDSLVHLLPPPDSPVNGYHKMAGPGEEQLMGAESTADGVGHEPAEVGASSSSPPPPSEGETSLTATETSGASPEDEEGPASPARNMVDVDHQRQPSGPLVISNSSEEQEDGADNKVANTVSEATAADSLKSGYELQKQPSGVHSDYCEEVNPREDGIGSDEEDFPVRPSRTGGVSFKSSPDPVPSLSSSPEEELSLLTNLHQKQPSGKLASEAAAAVAAAISSGAGDAPTVTTPPPPPEDGDGGATTILDVLQQQNREQHVQQDSTHPLHSPMRTSPNPNTPRTPAPTPVQQQRQHPAQHIAQNIQLPYGAQQLQQTSPYPAHQQMQQTSPYPTRAQMQPVQPQHPGRRSITLRLLEEITPPASMSSPLINSVKGFDTPFRSLRRFRSLSLSNKAMGAAAATAADADRTRSGGGLDPLDERTPSPTSSLKKGVSESTVDRGTIVVSWYEGTTSSEMTDHVFNCVLRKLNVDREREGRNKGGGKVRLEDVRLLDESVTPHGEVVLCPYLPDGSSFLLKFKTSVERPVTPQPPKVNHRVANPYASRAPDSPSAEPSPFPSSADLPSMSRNDVNEIKQQNARWEQQQLQTQQMLTAVAALLQQQQHPGLQLNLAAAQKNGFLPKIPPIPDIGSVETVPRQSPTTQLREEKKEEDGEATGRTTPLSTNVTNESGDSEIKRSSSSLQPLTMDPIAENPTDQLIEQQLRQLNDLFSQRRSLSAAPSNVGADATGGGTSDSNNDHQFSHHDEKLARAYRRDEKKQVIFVIANYLVLFMSLIALSAEIQSRLPQWMDWVQQNYDSVQNCATDRDALIECLSNGDFSGLVASFLLWATQSAAAKRIFLFGFDTPKKLWTVVYEALVTAVCWGTSYLFIRRGLNPNTRQNFLHKYWKDAVYGSLAGFNAAFMKAVLKNLVPQDVALEALEGRQLRIFHWLGSMMAAESS